MFAPALSVVVKLASIAVHAEEATSPRGHAFDLIALRSLLNDPEVTTLLAEMDRDGLIPPHPERLNPYVQAHLVAVETLRASLLRRARRLRRRSPAR